MSVAIAAPHAAAVDAGRRAAAAGGNALDAALAAAAMLTVVYPHQCAIGGDLIALVRDPDGRTTAVISAGTAPAAIAGPAATWREVPRQGAHAVTVPGMHEGWRTIHSCGARHELGEGLRGAARVAENGAPVSAGLERALDARADAVFADEGMSEVFAPGGDLLREGDPLVQPALAATLRRLADDPDDFLHGRTARALVATLRRHGGVHTVEDFASFRPVVTPGLSRTIGAATWTVAPPPSGGALLLGVAGAAAHGEGSIAARTLAASLRGVHARAAHLGDPDAGAVDLAALLALDSPEMPATAEPRPQGDTAAVVAVDEAGWAVTIVQSVYQTFGAGLLDPETGILLHNRGSAFSADPASPAAIRPGARPPHTLLPAIVDTAEATVVAGCQGGRAQPWILAQLLPDAIDPDVSLPALLRRPRWLVGDRDLGQDRLTVVLEPGADPEGVLASRAAELGIPLACFPGPADEAGHVQVVRTRSGMLEAASDPRADGVGVVTDGEHETVHPRREP